MITHKIEKYHRPLQINWPAKKAINHTKNESAVQSQDLLLDYLERRFKIGSIIINRIHHVAENVPVPLYNLHVIVDVETDFNNLRIDHSGTIESHLASNLNMEHGPWVRWINPDNFRLAEESELVQVKNDLVQNHIKRIFEAYSNQKTT